MQVEWAPRTSIWIGWWFSTNRIERCANQLQISTTNWAQLTVTIITMRQYTTGMFTLTTQVAIKTLTGIGPVSLKRSKEKSQRLKTGLDQVLFNLSTLKKRWSTQAVIWMKRMSNPQEMRIYSQRQRHLMSKIKHQPLTTCLLEFQ